MATIRSERRDMMGLDADAILYTGQNAGTYLTSMSSKMGTDSLTTSTELEEEDSLTRTPGQSVSNMKNQ
jgi:hypothetical protein